MFGGPDLICKTTPNKSDLTPIFVTDMEEGEVADSVLSARFSADDSDKSMDGTGSDASWSGDESASIIAARVRQEERGRNARQPTGTGKP